jgi:hypothetical protein
MKDYLTVLAERLVLTYEDEENAGDWASFAERVGKRQRLVGALRTALEHEVRNGSFRIDHDRHRLGSVMHHPWSTSRRTASD